MRTALRRALSTLVAGTVAAGGLLLASSPADAVSGACSSACIVADDISGTPDGAVFTFHTTTLTRAEVVVTDLNGANAYALSSDVTWSSNYELTASDSSRFHQGNVYRYTIFATDGGGATWRYSGEFVTLVRSASIHYSNLHVIKDGDDIGPGDFIGDGRCGDTPVDWERLRPLNDYQAPGASTPLNDGDNQVLNADFACPATVGATIDAQTAVADDDNNYLDPNPWWFPTSPYNDEWWDMPGYDEAYTTQLVADPLDPTATGSADAPINVTSPVVGTKDVANMRYQVTGTATFTHTAPMVVIPPATSGPATLGVHLVEGSSADSIAVSWQATAVPELGGSTATRVQWKPTSSATWQYADLLDTSVAGYTIPNVKPGTHYDVAVSRVMPGNLLALYSPASYFVLNGTAITGWPTTSVTAPEGTVVTTTVQVSTGGAPRTVWLQVKVAGYSGWASYATAQTDAAGFATVKSVVLPGYNQWRVYVPGTSTYVPATSASRTLIAKTSISGFATTSVTAPAGTKLGDAVVVTPAVNRLVTLFYRKTGGTTWTVQAQLTTDAAGKVTLPEVARKGSYQWQLVVPAAAKQGNGAYSAIRTITGS